MNDDTKSNFFLSMVGYVYDFYGVDNNTFCIGINGKRCAFEAIEDEDDGYRSYLDSVVVSMKDHIFFSTPIAQVRLEVHNVFHPRAATEKTFEGWRFIDVKDGHVWLTVGTDLNDDYYPYFTFDYEPKKQITPGV